MVGMGQKAWCAYATPSGLAFQRAVFPQGGASLTLGFVVEPLRGSPEGQTPGNCFTILRLKAAKTLKFQFLGFSVGYSCFSPSRKRFEQE